MPVLKCDEPRRRSFYVGEAAKNLFDIWTLCPLWSTKVDFVERRPCFMMPATGSLGKALLTISNPLLSVLSKSFCGRFLHVTSLLGFQGSVHFESR